MNESEIPVEVITRMLLDLTRFLVKQNLQLYKLNYQIRYCHTLLFGTNLAERLVCVIANRRLKINTSLSFATSSLLPQYNFA